MELSQRLNLDNLGALQPDNEPEADSSLSTLGQVAALIESVAGVNPDEVTPDSTPDSLGLDSLSRIELIVRAEEHFGVRIDEETALNFHTVDDLVTYLAQNT
ncbi:acyl carrier protein [Corynebacterium cystitidis]|uniref:acyl carrier protein n=1 Tax=Corynebacterium cystitidis TaxID=35757 RepID=UPI00211DAE57|nr:acyl carrier protein [Corynebacterium cystitidis]